VLSKGVEIGLRIGQMSGEEYVSLSISASELGSLRDARRKPRPCRG
jgi:hypothetical protein